MRVSPRRRRDFGNGRRDESFDGRPTINLPGDPRFRPSAEALEWHLGRRFKAG